MKNVAGSHKINVPIKVMRVELRCLAISRKYN